jgi:hypothetical protein
MTTLAQKKLLFTTRHPSCMALPVSTVARVAEVICFSCLLPYKNLKAFTDNLMGLVTFYFFCTRIPVFKSLPGLNKG